MNYLVQLMCIMHSGTIDNISCSFPDYLKDFNLRHDSQTRYSGIEQGKLVGSCQLLCPIPQY